VWNVEGVKGGEGPSGDEIQVTWFKRVPAQTLQFKSSTESEFCRSVPRKR